ncbi:3-oxoacyl-ACP reductase FabG [Agromyces sp. NPDC049794]|uniref:3-oxoacyl-ACP reductase FabG n=1 Tax=unclassified Agromyces TaxID=2639701 RepID=UPI003411BA8E
MDAKVALVTGASRGLGRAIAVALSKADYNVVAAARSEKGAAETAEMITSAGGRAIPFRCDVRDGESIEATVAATVAEYGRLDVLVNNAGITRDAGMHRMTDEDWDAVIETTLTGGFRMSRAAQHHMVSRGEGGRIIFIGSIASNGSRGQVNYAAAKAGLIGLAKSMALELGRYDITVNVISPGHVETEMTHGVARNLGVDYEEIRQARISANALNRVGTPDDIAAAATYLASDAAGYVTGSVLVVAGKPV